MSNYLEFECTPIEEPCAQVGWDHYSVVARIEARVMIEQLEQKFGDLGFFVASAPHDFGSYYEIRVPETELAYVVDEKFHVKWNKESKRLLDVLCQEKIGVSYKSYLKNKGKIK